MKTIDIHLCENNNSGSPSGRVSMIDFLVDDEIVLHLEAIDLEAGEPVYTSSVAGGATIQMYGNSIKTDARDLWAGNKLWNKYTASVGYALGFVNLLSDSKKFTVASGDTTLYKAFYSHIQIIASDFGIDEDVEPLLLNPNQTELDFVPAPVMKPVRISPLSKPLGTRFFPEPSYICDYCTETIPADKSYVVAKLDKDINGTPVNYEASKICPDCVKKTKIYCIEKDCWNEHARDMYCQRHFDEYFIFCVKCKSNVHITTNCRYKNCPQGNNHDCIAYLQKFEDRIENRYHISNEIKDNFVTIYDSHKMHADYRVCPIWLNDAKEETNSSGYDFNRAPDYWNIDIISIKEHFEAADKEWEAAGFPKQEPYESKPYEDPNIPKIIYE